ncbi:MAG TPA: glutathione peroxidase [Alphaproteobacteria bacterium]|nr:glutathione peroxidase [Alphaproteobacteria bacterium]
MLRRRSLLRAFLAVGGTLTALQRLVSPAKGEVFAKDRPRRTSMTAHEFTFTSIDGPALPMKAWTGRPVLVVNTASFCGYTPQYATLEKLWEAYKDKGFVLLGVPSNDFGQQEPGTASEIKAFCETYDVSFPLSRKEKVIGAEAHPFYRWIASELGEGGAPRWNFHKYLVGPDGLLAGAWPSAVEPTDKDITQAIDAALKATS